MNVDPTGKVLVMALSWNYLVDYCRDCIMAVVARDRVMMSWMVHALTLTDEASASALSHPVLAHDDTSVHHNLELAIVPHYLFLDYYNMDPRWNCLGYQNILGVMSVAVVMIVESKFWLNRTPLNPPTCSYILFICMWVIMAISFPSAFWPLIFNWWLQMKAFFYCFLFLSFSLLVPLIDCWCCALIKFDHVSFCIEIWLIFLASFSFWRFFRGLFS